jgi:hypothetical protein
VASDLAVRTIGLPATVMAPCPTPVDVEIINLGADPAPFPISVCLAVLPATGDAVLSEAVELVRGTEGQALPPMGTEALRFSVSFPCVTQARLRATADCLAPKVPNNAASTPSQDVLVQPIAAAAWLSTDFRLGVRDATGGTIWDPAQLCLTSDLVVEARITNRGCAWSGNSFTELQLSGRGGYPLTAMKHVTPGIAPGKTYVWQFLLPMPSSPVPLASLGISVCADTTNLVTGQCDRASLCKTINHPVSTQAGSPSVSFSVDAPIRPGGSPQVSWGLDNDCSDLVSVTATILFGGTVVYKSKSLAVGPSGKTGEKGAVIPKVTDPAIAAAVYRIGTQTLDLRIDASGNDPGPYHATATMNGGREYR